MSPSIYTIPVCNVSFIIAVGKFFNPFPWKLPHDILLSFLEHIFVEYLGAADDEVTGAGELPPCALSEPGVSLPAHRAPIIQPSVARQTAILTYYFSPLTFFTQASTSRPAISFDPIPKAIAAAMAIEPRSKPKANVTISFAIPRF